MTNPLVIESLRAAVFDFCEATLDTIVGDLETGLTRLRGSLIRQIGTGDTYREMAKRTATIIQDEFRAARVAQTEATRAIHQGGQFLAKLSGVAKGKKWLASSDACDLCLSLMAKGVIGLDEPYAVIPGAKPAYAVIYHPGAHPWCACSETFQI